MTHDEVEDAFKKSTRYVKTSAWGKRIVVNYQARKLSFNEANNILNEEISKRAIRDLGLQYIES